ncbi:MAG: hypothetical protein ACRDVG_03405 [Jatrophihabitantaceae bacterium]
MAGTADGPRTAGNPSPSALPLVWRIPPWQPAALILLATVLIAFLLYGSPSLGASVAMGVVALAALASAAFAARLLMVADDDGIWVRRALGVQLVEWAEVSTVEAVPIRGNTMTVRITRTTGTYVDVPPSLLLPTLPTAIRKVRSIVHGTALQLADLAAQRQR